MIKAFADFATKVNADMDRAFEGRVPWKPLAAHIKAESKRGQAMGWTRMARLPCYVSFYEKKPAFHLDDTGTLQAYQLDAVTGEVLGVAYCGTYESALNNEAAQLREGGVSASGRVIAFVRTTYGGSGRGTIWTLHVVMPPQVPALPPIALSEQV